MPNSLFVFGFPFFPFIFLHTRRTGSRMPPSRMQSGTCRSLGHRTQLITVAENGASSGNTAQVMAAKCDGRWGTAGGFWLAVPVWLVAVAVVMSLAVDSW